MAIRDALEKTLSSPSVADLWRLRGELLEAGIAADSKVWTVIDEFHRFLDQLATSTSSREYSELASKLDIGAISGVLLEQALTEAEAEELALRLVSGLLSEGLMVLATRQHVKAWKGEADAVYRTAAWFLYGELWRWAERLKPDLPAAQRRRLLDRLFGPVRSTDSDGFTKAVLLGLMFQILLLSHLAGEFPP